MTLSLPRKLMSDIAHPCDELNSPMHELLEKNADGALGAMEKAELAAMVRVAEFGQIISTALQTKIAP